MTPFDMLCKLGFLKGTDPIMKNRSKAYTRYQRERVIQRKWVILKDILQREGESMPVRGTLREKSIVLVKYAAMSSIMAFQNPTIKHNGKECRKKSDVISTRENSQN